MGILTDAFIATDAEVATVDFAHKMPSELFPTLEAKRVDTIKLGTLEAIMAGADAAEIARMDVEAFVDDLGRKYPWIRDIGAELGEGESSNGPWVCRLPDSLTTRLAELSPAEIVRFGRAWAATEEWQADGRQSDDAIADIVEYLRKLSQLAKGGVAEVKNVYLWISL
jgi:hypothetical protein